MNQTLSELGSALTILLAREGAEWVKNWIALHTKPAPTVAEFNALLDPAIARSEQAAVDAEQARVDAAKV